jgi:DNA-binding transcriptional regulator YbjK
MGTQAMMNVMRGHKPRRMKRIAERCERMQQHDGINAARQRDTDARIAIPLSSDALYGLIDRRHATVSREL